MYCLIQVSNSSADKFQITAEGGSLLQCLVDGQQSIRTGGHFVACDTNKNVPDDSVVYDSRDPEATLDKLIGNLSDVSFDNRANFSARSVNAFA